MSDSSQLNFLDLSAIPKKILIKRLIKKNKKINFSMIKLIIH